MSEETAKQETVERKKRKTRTGVVTSDSMDKTIAVKVSRIFQHKLYGKSLEYSKKYLAHDENNECKVGDTVRIMETRPISKRKCWRLVEILEKAK